MISVVVFSLIFAVFVIFYLYFLLSYFTGAPYLPTPHKIVRQMIDAARIKKGDKIADLGSGDGRILIAAARKGVKATGWEINPVLVLWTKVRAHFLGLNKKITVHCRDYRKARLKPFTVIFLYSISDKIKAIEKKLLPDLRKNSRIISYKFPLPNLKLKYKTASDIYVYYI